MKSLLLRSQEEVKPGMGCPLLPPANTAYAHLSHFLQVVNVDIIGPKW